MLKYDFLSKNWILTYVLQDYNASSRYSIWLLLHVVKVNVAIKLTISQKYLAVTLTLLLLTLFYVYYELAIYIAR